ncbi:hypothetical protein ACIA8B_22815 [Micromonospora chalcea]
MLRRPPALSAPALSFTGVSLVNAFSDLPNWTVVLLLVLVTVISILRIVFPQQSKDRLAWWQGWWSRPSRRRQSKTRKR